MRTLSYRDVLIGCMRIREIEFSSCGFEFRFCFMFHSSQEIHTNIGFYQSCDFEGWYLRYDALLT
jgi:hypothetical protein